VDSIESQLQEIEPWCRRREYDVALRLCNKLLDEHPHSREALWSRAFIFGGMGDTESAIGDLTRIIALRSEEPCYFTERAHRLIDAGRYAEAVEDLTETLRLCDQWDSDHYRAVAHFVRAYAYLRLGRPNDALADCHHVRDGFSWWIEHGLRTKAEITAEAKAMLSGKPSPEGDPSTGGES
jgi:tetratricopeptide (TPR) repeat protein